MPESLGDALLYLRTDDSAFTAGVGAAEGKAVKLGGTLDRTTAKSGELSTALTRTGGAAKTAARELDTASRSGAQFERTSTAIVKSSGAQAMGVRQLTQNLGDMTTMYALGMRPQQIFASQIGQVAQAVQLAAGDASKFAAFLGSGFGLALMLAVQLLGPFIGKLFETSNELATLETHLDQAAEAADSFGTAQTLLGKVMDLTTGKMKSQNQVLIETIRLQAQVGILKAQQDENAARKSLSSVGQPTSWQRIESAIASGGGGTVPMSSGQGAAIMQGIVADRAPLRQLAGQIASGSLTDATKIADQVDAIVKAGHLADLSTAKIIELKEQLIKLPQALNDKKAYQQVIDALDGKGLGDLAQPKPATRPKAAPKDHSAQIANRNAAEMARLGQEETRAQLDLTTNIDDRAQLQMELLTQERADRVREIDSNKSLTAKERAARLALIDRLYGNPNSSVGPNGEIVVDGNDVGLYGQKVMRDVREREARLANDALSRQSAALGAQASITTNLKERDALEQKILELQQQIQRNVLEQQIANGDVADAVKARATLAKQQAVQREGLSRSQEGPLAAYARSLNASNDNLDAQVQSYIVDELQSVRDSLHAGIRKITGTDDPLINGLIQMFIEQTLIRPIANSLSQVNGLGGGGGLFGGLLHGVIGAFGGGGSVTGWLNGGSTAGLGFGGSFTTIAGMRATGGPIAAGNAYLVGERGPEIVVPHAPGYVLPNGSAPAGGKGDFNLSITVNGARGNAEIQEMVNAGVKQGIAGYDEVVANRVQDHLRRRSS